MPRCAIFIIERRRAAGFSFYIFGQLDLVFHSVRACVHIRAYFLSMVSEAVGHALLFIASSSS